LIPGKFNLKKQNVSLLKQFGRIWRIGNRHETLLPERKKYSTVGRTYLWIFVGELKEMTVGKREF